MSDKNTLHVITFVPLISALLKAVGYLNLLSFIHMDGINYSILTLLLSDVGLVVSVVFFLILLAKKD